MTLAFSSDSSLLAVGSTKQIRLLGSPKLPHFKEVSYGENVWGTALVFSPDDSVIVRGLAAGRIQLWDVTTGDKLTTLDGTHGHSKNTGVLCRWQNVHQCGGRRYNSPVGLG